MRQHLGAFGRALYPGGGNVARHAANLRGLGVNGLMLGWTLGGYPSPNLEVVAEIGSAPAGAGAARPGERDVAGGASGVSGRSWRRRWCGPGRSTARPSASSRSTAAWSIARRCRSAPRTRFGANRRAMPPRWLAFLTMIWMAGARSIRRRYSSASSRRWRPALSTRTQTWPRRFRCAAAS